MPKMSRSIEKQKRKIEADRYRQEYRTYRDERYARENATRLLRAGTKIHYARSRFINGAIGLVVPLLVLVFICRMLFSNGQANVSVDSLFLDVLQRFSTQNWNVDYLMWTISNFSEISAWTTDTSGILEALKTIVSIFGYIGNIVLLIIALIIQAGAVITFMFSVLTGA